MSSDEERYVRLLVVTTNKYIAVLLYSLWWVGNVFQIQKETSAQMYIHIFESDLINNMDHMRISGTEPS